MNNHIGINFKFICLFLFFLFLTSIYYFITFTGFLPFVGDMTYMDLSISMNILNDNGIVGGPRFDGTTYPFTKRAMGYPVAVAFVSHITNLDLLNASRLISYFSFLLLGSTIFLFLKAYSNKNILTNFLITLIFLSYPPIISFSHYSSPEIFSLAILSLCFYLLFIFEKIDLYKSKLFCIGFGLLISFSFLIHYSYLVIVLLFLSYVWLKKIKTSSFPISNFVLLNTFILIPICSIFYRNYIHTGSISGHPISGIATNSFLTAFTKSINTILGSNLVFSNLFAVFILSLLLVIFLFNSILILKRLFSSDKFFKIDFIKFSYAGFILYLLYFCTIQSITRIDDVSIRYLFPAVFFVFMFLLTFLNKINLKIKYINLALMLILIIIFSYSFNRFIIKDFSKIDRSDYSPQTVSYMLNEIPIDSGLLCSRYCSQIRMFTDKYRLKGIPFNSSYNKAYNRKLVLTEENFLDLIKNKKINYIVFLEGKDKKDKFMRLGQYGSFVESLYNEKELNKYIKSATNLSDGLILEVNPYEP